MKKFFVSPVNTVRENVRARRDSPAGNSSILFTCEYCFSHYVAAGVLAVARFRMLFKDWRGWFVALFALVWIANQYMSIYNRLRLDIKGQQVEIQATEQKVAEQVAERKAA